MVFISRGRGRGGNRGRGRGVGEVAFESSRPAHGQGVGRDSRQAPESLRITVGNDQFRDRKEDNISGRLSPSVSQRLGPPKESYLHEREADYRREDDMYRREAEIYGQSDRQRFERERDYDRREQYSRDPHPRPEEREYGDRRGLGGGGYEQPPSEYRHQPTQPLFPVASRSPPPRFSAQPAVPSPAQASSASRPLKSILKKKADPVPEEKPPAKPSGLPGIANYMDDIEDEDKFLYGGDDDRDRRSNERDRRESGQYRQQPHGVPIEDMRANIRSAAQSWQPSAPQKTVSGVVSDFVNAQREYVDSSKSQHYGSTEPYQSQPVQSSAPVGNSGGNDLWSMLAKSVQTVQQQQQIPGNQYESQPESYQPSLSAQSAQPSYPAQPAQDAQAAGAAHDPTIENILKSIGFDFEMSKRMQEKAKQSSGEVVQQAPKPGDPQFINQTATFLGTQMSHEEMVSQLGPPHHEREAPLNVVERVPEPVQNDYRERELYENRDRRGSSEASRGRLNSPARRISSPTRRTNSPPRRISSPPRRISSPTRRISSPPRMLSSPPRRQSPEKLQRGCSPVSAEGSPPPPMFNLPPITIKRRPNIERSRSPGWEKNRSLSRSPTRDSDRSRNRPRSKSPSWNRSLSSYGRKRSPSPGRKRSVSPQHSKSPAGRTSPVIKRTFNLDDLSPAFRRRVSPMLRQRSLSPVSPERSPSPGRRRNISPGRRSISPSRRRSPGRRRSISPGRRRSFSPGKRRSRSPGRRRSRSPVRRRSRSPMGRRSRSPVGRRTRSPMGRRSRSPMGRRSSRSPVRRRSRSPRRHSPSPRGRRRSISPRGRKRGPSSRSRSRERKMRRSTSRDRSHRGSPGRGRRSSSRDRNRKRSRSRSRSPRKGRRSLSVSSDSDIDGPANKQYYSSPLRLSRQDKQKIPRYYDFPPPQQGPPPLDFSAPPFPGYGPPPGSFPPGTQPGMPPIVPPGPPPMMSIPPPGMGPPMGPPVSFPYPPPGPLGPIYAVPGPPNLSQPPPVLPEPDMAPPGTVEMPLQLPGRSNLTEIVSDDKKDDHMKEPVEERRRERSRSRERTKDKREERKSERTSSSSNRTVLPPKPRPKAEDIEIKASTTSNERVVVLSGKPSKSSSTSKEEKRIDPEKEKAKIVKEKESMVTKIRALEKEFNNLKKQEFDLRKRTGKDNRPDPILIENKKLLEEIKKEIVKLNKQKNDFESKHSAIFKREQPTKREIKVTPKKTPVKEDKSKTGDKKTEKEEFKVEKGKLMKHYFHDAGDHWCKPCNSLHPNIQDYMHHLASYKHKQTLPSDFRPWMDGYKANDGMIINKKGIRVPLPGIEFMLPVTAYYCQLCKVFLGDVSFGADHFKCESHYINYKKYLADNPIYEKKYKEERDKVLSLQKTAKKEEQVRKAQKAKEDVKQKNTEKDARVRENEKKWDKSVDDLNDVNSSTTKQEASKSQIKLSLKDQKSENNEKGFGKFNWNKDKKTGEQKNGQKTPEAGQEKDKGKINFNISLSGKSTGKSIVGKTGAQKKNPLLPPWQPVGKKTETFGKPGETASLDQFLTTNTGEGKIPVISEKKKVSAKEILEAFSGKYKEKEIGPSLKKEDDLVKDTVEKKEAVKDTVEKKEVINQEEKEQMVKSKKEIQEDKDKRMMGIDPDAEVPLAAKKPPPPVSQNVPLPDQKPSATVDENDVHKVFNSGKTGDTEKQVSVAIDLKEIPIPETETEVAKTVDLKEIPVPEPEMPVTVTVDLEEIPVPETEKAVVETVKLKEVNVPLPAKKEEISEPKNMKEDTEERSTDKILDNQDSSVTNVETKQDLNEPKGDSKNETETEFSAHVGTSSMETVIDEAKEELKIEAKEEIDEEKAQNYLEIKTDQTETDMELNKTEIVDSVKEVEISVKTIEAAVAMEFEDGEQVPTKAEDSEKQEKRGEESVKADDDKTESAVEDNNKADTKMECLEEDKSKLDAKTDDSETETEEPVIPSVPEKGRGRGRGRKRGRGRGRGKTRPTPVRSTRSTRSSKAVEVQEESIDIAEFDIDSENIDSTESSKDSNLFEIGNKVSELIETKNKDSELSETNKDSEPIEINKDSELNISVQVAKAESGKSKKSISPRIRKTSLKSDPAKVEQEETSDKEDAQSETSGVSMHMDSDFEVVDDLEDMEVLDEAV